MKTNFSLLFYLKKPKNHQNGLVPIYLRITVNGKRAETSTGRECVPVLWNRLDKDPFVNYKAKVKRVDRIFLNREELQAISDKVFPTERLNQVRDIFLFCYFTGLAYADVKKLKPAEIVKGMDGEMWIYTKRTKTHQAIFLYYYLR